MVSRESDERPSSPVPRRKARTRPPDVTEARASTQRAKLDAQAKARNQQLEASEGSKEQPSHASRQRCTFVSSLALSGSKHVCAVLLASRLFLVLLC